MRGGYCRAVDIVDNACSRWELPDPGSRPYPLWVTLWMAPAVNSNGGVPRGPGQRSPLKHLALVTEGSRILGYPVLVFDVFQQCQGPHVPADLSTQVRINLRCQGRALLSTPDRVWSCVQWSRLGPWASLVSTPTRAGSAPTIQCHTHVIAPWWFWLLPCGPSMFLGVRVWGPGLSAGGADLETRALDILYSSKPGSGPAALPPSIGPLVYPLPFTLSNLSSPVAAPLPPPSPQHCGLMYCAFAGSFSASLQHHAIFHPLDFLAHKPAQVLLLRACRPRCSVELCGQALTPRSSPWWGTGQGLMGSLGCLKAASGPSTSLWHFASLGHTRCSQPLGMPCS